MQKKKGVSLIVLVITIIVMIILAAAVIVTLNGGIINYAGQAKKETLIATGLEQIEAQLVFSYSNGKIDLNKLKSNLKSINGITTEDDEEIDENAEISLPILVKLYGINYVIKTDGSIRIKEEGIDAYDVLKHPEQYYGMYVTNYNSPSDVGIADEEGQLGKWQIFMADEDNIYLIASSYINFDYAPVKNDKAYSYDTSIEDTSTVYKMWWNNNLKNQYNSASQQEIILSKFNDKTKNTYHKWLVKNPNGYINSSCKAVLNMLDVDLWSIYKNADYAEYAIGGPTIEMFCASYNSTHTNKLTPKENYEYGYRFQFDDSNDVYNYGYIDVVAVNDMANKMLFSNQRVNEYHIASPSACYASGAPWMYAVTSRNLLGSAYNSWGENYTGGFRPLVCLKTDIHLLENVENNNVTYQLY